MLEVSDEWLYPRLHITARGDDSGALEPLGEHPLVYFGGVPVPGDILCGISDVMPVMRVFRRTYVRGEPFSWWWLEVDVPPAVETAEVLALNGEVRRVYAKMKEERAAETFAALAAHGQKKSRRPK